MELHFALRDAVDRMGRQALEDPSSVRGVLDDVLGDDVASVGDLNLLADAVRFGAIPHLLRMVAEGADPGAAVEAVGAQVARDRGGADLQASVWACAVVGFALGVVAEPTVLRWRTQPQTLPAAPGAAVTMPAAVGQAAVTMPAPSPTDVRWPPSGRSGRRAWPIVIAVAAIVGVASGVGIATMGSDERPSTKGTSSGEPSSESRRVSGDEGSSSDRGSPGGAQTAPSGGLDIATIQCWDGAEVVALRSCTFPTGVRGMQWIFPLSKAGSCGVVARGLHGRLLDRYCPVDLPNGKEAQFHYSEWPDHDRMRLNYRADQGGLDLELGRQDLHAFPVADVDAESKVVLFYRLPDAPWSVTLYASSAADMDLALASLQIRPVKQLRGTGRQQQNLPTSFEVVEIAAR